MTKNFKLTCETAKFAFSPVTVLMRDMKYNKKTGLLEPITIPRYLNLDEQLIIRREVELPILLQDLPGGLEPERDPIFWLKTLDFNENHPTKAVLVITISMEPLGEATPKNASFSEEKRDNLDETT